MSRRKDARYADEIREGGRVLIYEGHDEQRRRGAPDPKTIDQPDRLPSGRSTENGHFFEAAESAAKGLQPPIVVHVYEKLQKGVWTFNGRFQLTDAWKDTSTGRRIFKFQLELMSLDEEDPITGELPHTRMIPSAVKREVWKRDHGRCRICQVADNLHFDHVLPFSLGGSSLVAENIQLLCARHNLQKSDRIE